MKKFIVLTLILVGAGSFLQAQIPVGFQVGANYNKPVSGESPSLKNSFTAPYLGIVAELPAGRFMFRPSTNYLRESYYILKTVLNQPNTDSAIAQLSINSLELPLDIIYRWKANTVTFFICAAPTLTLGLKGTADSVNGSGVSQHDVQFGNDDGEVKKAAYAGRIGGGVNFNNNIELNLMYKVALNDLSNNETTIKNKSLTVSVTCFLFKLRKRQAKENPK